MFQFGIFLKILCGLPPVLFLKFETNVSDIKVRSDLTDFYTFSVRSWNHSNLGDPSIPKRGSPTGKLLQLWSNPINRTLKIFHPLYRICVSVDRYITEVSVDPSPEAGIEFRTPSYPNWFTLTPPLRLLNAKSVWYQVESVIVWRTSLNCVWFTSTGFWLPWYIRNVNIVNRGRKEKWRVTTWGVISTLDIDVENKHFIHLSKTLIRRQWTGIWGALTIT